MSYIFIFIILPFFSVVAGKLAWYRPFNEETPALGVASIFIFSFAVFLTYLRFTIDVDPTPSDKKWLFSEALIWTLLFEISMWGIVKV